MVRSDLRRAVGAGLRLALRHSGKGQFAGGFPGDRWLGQSEPQPPLENQTLTKYKLITELIIDDFGSWSLFQVLLQTLRRIADRHGGDIACVAGAAMLNRPAVAAMIVGARNRSDLARNVAICERALVRRAGGALAGEGLVGA